MPEIQTGNGAHTICSHGKELAREHSHDWMVLILLASIDLFLNIIEPFHRYVGEEMMVDMKYPFYEKDTIPMYAVPSYAVVLPCVVFFMYYLYRKDVYDLHHAILGLFYAVLITAVITDSIKDATGSFAGLGFLAWYLCGKLRTFDNKGHVASLCIVVSPYLFAALVGVSRVDDYWHHWTDVFTGAIIGWAPHAFFHVMEREHSVHTGTANARANDLEGQGGETRN
ncbi:Phosphatidic acid phosphatase/chloroperoxidase, N-terminal [Cynara cardunculus var. scolymus]|uniref:Phosphatidic acid phosphatase/chloroperoxidase, N-terminal n=1 Tax=Cynara cardunculus var. scolymus TaxID=59895 RepID=A0A118K4H1_CYNCS|nr:Phosphatidic acid phosphatase/chloroperoxidase, N-terminal [Cynara cardunculus var. scolymus]